MEDAISEKVQFANAIICFFFLSNIDILFLETLFAHILFFKDSDTVENVFYRKLKHIYCAMMSSVVTGIIGIQTTGINRIWDINFLGQKLMAHAILRPHNRASPNTLTIRCLPQMTSTCQHLIANEAADHRRSAVELANHRATHEYRRKISSQRKGPFFDDIWV